METPSANVVEQTKADTTYSQEYAHPLLTKGIKNFTNTSIKTKFKQNIGNVNLPIKFSSFEFSNQDAKYNISAVPDVPNHNAIGM